MFSRKLFLVSITLILINLIYSAAKIYQPDLFDAIPLTFSDEIIPLLINSLFIILVCFLFFTQKKKMQAKLDEMQSNVVLPAIQHSKSAVYSDITLIDNIPNLFCIKDQNGRWLQASPEYLETLELLFTDYIGKTDAYLAINSTGNNVALQENILQDKNAWKKGLKINFDFCNRTGIKN